jgi:hypothetical protein
MHSAMQPRNTCRKSQLLVAYDNRSETQRKKARRRVRYEESLMIRRASDHKPITQVAHLAVSAAKPVALALSPFAAIRNAFFDAIYYDLLFLTYQEISSVGNYGNARR